MCVLSSELVQTPVASAPTGSRQDSQSPATTSLNSLRPVWLRGRSVAECGVPVGTAPVGDRVEQHPKRVHVPA